MGQLYQETTHYWKQKGPLHTPEEQKIELRDRIVQSTFIEKIMMVIWADFVEISNFEHFSANDIFNGVVIKGVEQYNETPGKHDIVELPS
jgi:hypothetical protein